VYKNNIYLSALLYKLSISIKFMRTDVVMRCPLIFEYTASKRITTPQNTHMNIKKLKVRFNLVNFIKTGNDKLKRILTTYICQIIVVSYKSQKVLIK